MQYLGEKYSNDGNLDSMRSASYHQQVTNDHQPECWTIFEGHVDKNFVHTAWFVPLTGGTFYTFIAVPISWNVPPHQDSEREYQEWLSTMEVHNREKLHFFKETFDQQAKLFMKVSNIQVLVYCCSVGTFLSFPANLCYHATVQTTKSISALGKMKDLLILYPTESG
jgi:hypothetical protein